MPWLVFYGEIRSDATEGDVDHGAVRGIYSDVGVSRFLSDAFDVTSDF